MSAEPLRRHEIDALDNERLWRLAVVEADAYAQHVFAARFAPLVRLAALRIVGDAQMASEIEVETLRRVLMNAAAQEVHSVGAFLHAVTRNAALTALDQRGRHSRVVVAVSDFRSELHQSVHSDDDVGLTPERPLEHARLRAALERLRPQQCRALELFYFEELSYVAIAERLEITVEAVKSHLQNGRKRLHHLLTRA